MTYTLSLHDALPISYSTNYSDEFMYSEPGDYILKVRVRDYKNIDQVFEYPIKVYDTTDINNIGGNSEKMSFEIYPNPATQLINLKGINENETISIYNLQGIKIKEVIYDGSLISIEDLINGCYIMKCSDYRSVILIKN